MVVLAVAVGFALTRARSFEATARILVNPLPADDTSFIGLPLIRDSGDPTRTMETVATLVDSAQAAQATAGVVGRGWTERRVARAVAVQPEGQSDILDVTASAGRADVAAGLANAFARSALAIRAQQLRGLVARAIAADKAQLAAISSPSSVAAANITDALDNLQSVADGRDPTISFSQPAVVPGSPSGLSRPLVVLVGVLAGAALAAGVVLVIELVRTRRVNVEEELLGVLPAPVLARMPVLRRGLRGRAGVQEPLPAPVGEALRGVRIQLDLLLGRHRTILLTSASHGDGKTTVAVNLAREMARSGARVLIIDADLRKPEVGARLGVEPVAPLAEALESVDPTVFARLAPGLADVGVLAARADPQFQTLDRVRGALDRALERVLVKADYVLIDAPPLGEVADVLRFISSVDDVLLVSRLGHTSTGSLKVTRELLDLAGRAPTGHIIIGLDARHAPSYAYYATNGKTADQRQPATPLPPVRSWSRSQ